MESSAVRLLSRAGCVFYISGADSFFSPNLRTLIYQPFLYLRRAAAFSSPFTLNQMAHTHSLNYYMVYCPISLLFSCITSLRHHVAAGKSKRALDQSLKGL